MRILKIAMLFAVLFLVPVAQAAETGTTHFHGVNLPQAGFGAEHLPGKLGQDYMWPSVSDTILFGAMGSNILRVAFLWERMQPELMQDLQPQELAQLDALVATAAQQHITILIDVHNYGAYNQKLIGSDDVPQAAFDDLWTRLATHYKNQPYVVFGLMNEPNKQTPQEWAAIAQHAIYAIRKTGAKQTIFVPGANWSGAHSWLKKASDGMSNGDALANIKDPANDLVIEAHEYFDVDSSGTHPSCVNEDVGVQRLAAFTDWLRQTHHRGFLGEFGASKDPVCLAALQKTLKYMADNNDVWYGWTYWAAAAWFGNYMFNIYPPDPAKFPQVDILKNAM